MKKVLSLLKIIGLDLVKLYSNIIYFPAFLIDIITYTKVHQGNKFPLKFINLRPILTDKREEAGSIGGHYFFQDIWAAKLILRDTPKLHIDIGSRIDGFISHLLCFRDVTVVDIRPVGDHHIQGLNFIQADATNLEIYPDNSVESISSLHAIEHFGLGRYGDEIDPIACFKVMSSFQRVLMPGGRLYLSVPIGSQKLKFNAHRVFSPYTIIESLGLLHLQSFSAVNDEGRFCSPANIQDYLYSKNSCGLFEFIKQQ